MAGLVCKGSAWDFWAKHGAMAAVKNAASIEIHIVLALKRGVLVPNFIAGLLYIAKFSKKLRRKRLRWANRPL